MGKLFDLGEYTKKYGKPDIERLGVFVEMPYLPGGMGKKGKTKNVEVLRSMLPGGPKTKCATMDGYFGDKFMRVFQGERGKQKGKVDSKLASRVIFIPTGPAKKHSTPGDHFGTFGGKFTEFSPKLRPQRKKEPEKPNPVTNPCKKGGPGYVNITIGKYPEHKNERPKKDKTETVSVTPMITGTHPRPYFLPNPYRDPKHDPPTKRLYIMPDSKENALAVTFLPTGPAKSQGGCHAGCFDKWPAHKPEKYLSPAQIEKFVKQVKGKRPAPVVEKSEKYNPPSMALKTMFTKSTLQKTDYAVNATNWRVYEPNYNKYFL